MEKLEWSGLEYEEKERGADWFLALGIIIFSSVTASIIYHNYFFATLLLLSGILLGFFATKKPDTISYELNERGLKAGTHLYPYENIQSFYIQIGASPKGEILKPTLFIKSERAFMPILSIPIEDNIAEDIHYVLSSQNVPEEEMREHLSFKVMEMLGF